MPCEYWVQSNTTGTWNESSLVYTDNQPQQPQQQNSQVLGRVQTLNPDCAVTECVTSPPFASYSAILQDGEELELLSFDPLSKNSTIRSQSEDFKTEAGMKIQGKLDAVELVSFSLGQQRKMSAPVTPRPAPAILAVAQNVKTTKYTAPKRPSLRRIWRSDDDEISLGISQSAKRGYYARNEDDRGFRKKSREKRRREEVKEKFDVLVELLGITNRVRKNVVLEEAVSTIEDLKRERNELLMDRDRLQLEVNKLLLQFSQIKPENAANNSTMVPLPNRPYSDIDPSVFYHQQPDPMWCKRASQ